jgi:hypothetical protein
VHNVGTRGKRASSWLNNPHAPVWAFFSRRQFFPRCLLLRGVSSQRAIRRPIRPQGMARTEIPHRRALPRDPRALIERGGHLLIGPMRPVEPTTLGAVFHPPLDRRRQRLWNPPRLAWSPVDLEACHASFVLLREPAPHGGAMHTHILGNGPAFASPTGHQDRLAPVAEPSVSSRLENVFELHVFRCGQPYPSHLLPPSHETSHKRVAQKRCKLIRCMY